MSRRDISETGKIVAVFAHRFVLERGDGSWLLADLGPRGLEVYPLLRGADVSIVGERKPSEIKVFSVTPRGGDPIPVPHGKHADIDASVEAALAEAAGPTAPGSVRLDPKHRQVLARREDRLVGVHAAFDGTIRTQRPADATKGVRADQPRPFA